MDARQRQRVADNIGLVHVHLRRRVRAIPRPRWDGEREDLFQEGCLGLIRAAIAYDPASGIPFAAFAMLRIHNAVSVALQQRFQTVRLPQPARAGETASQGDSSDTAASVEPRVQHLSPFETESLVERRDAREAATECETVGDRLRHKYDRAVQAATTAMFRQPSRRGDRRQLVRLLVKERFEVPQEQARRALRQIARDTHSSYARVAECDRQLGEAIRRRLEVDPEFQTLREQARRAPTGTSDVIDASFERTLASSSSDAFVARFALAGPDDRTRLLGRLLALPGAPPPDELLRHHVAALPQASRERLWEPDETTAPPARVRRRSA